MPARRGPQKNHATPAIAFQEMDGAHLLFDAGCPAFATSAPPGQIGLVVVLIGLQAVTLSLLLGGTHEVLDVIGLAAARPGHRDTDASAPTDRNPDPAPAPGPTAAADANTAREQHTLTVALSAVARPASHWSRRFSLVVAAAIGYQSHAGRSGRGSRLIAPRFPRVGRHNLRGMRQRPSPRPLTHAGAPRGPVVERTFAWLDSFPETLPFVQEQDGRSRGGRPTPCQDSNQDGAAGKGGPVPRVAPV